MGGKPVYVELAIDADMEVLWAHTQKPELHEQWDLRFTTIDYLPRENEADPQPFLYTTRIGFGLRIHGTGLTRGSSAEREGERMSSLQFASEQKASLISRGSGYWKYKRTDKGVVFATQFDYHTRYGAAGRWLDRAAFRPLFGFATAWSFDRLRIWLEQGIPPSIIAERALVHYCAVGLLAVLWLYQGLVPKLLFPEGGELALLTATGAFRGIEPLALKILGASEMVIAVLSCLWHRHGWASWAQTLLLAALTLPAIVSEPSLLQSPFNPLTIALPMLGLNTAVALTRRHLPNAGRCIRRRSATPRKGADAA